MQTPGGGIYIRSAVGLLQCGGRWLHIRYASKRLGGQCVLERDIEWLVSTSICLAGRWCHAE